MEVAAGVQDQLADELAGGAVEDFDVEVVDEHGDSGSGQAGTEADVVQAAVVPRRDGAALATNWS